MDRPPIPARLPAMRAWIPIGIIVALLVVMLVTMSRVPSTITAPRGPIPAPAPAVVSGADFPEHSRRWGGCRAVVDRSTAIANQRSERANVITTELLSDACFGA